jgi:hypothetical protein
MKFRHVIELSYRVQGKEIGWSEVKLEPALVNGATGPRTSREGRDIGDIPQKIVESREMIRQHT